MKKFIKNNLLGFILGAIVFGSIGVYATIRIQADEIGYKDGTVEDALNVLYSSVSAEIGSLHSSLSYGHSRLTENTTTLQLTKNKYVCEAIYAETNSNSVTQSYLSENSGGVDNLNISGCDTIEYLGKRGVGIGTQQSYGGFGYAIVGLYKKIFTCEVNSTKNITATFSTSASWPAYQVHLDCIDIQ